MSKKRKERSYNSELEYILKPERPFLWLCNINVGYKLILLSKVLLVLVTSCCSSSSPSHYARGVTYSYHSPPPILNHIRPDIFPITSIHFFSPFLFHLLFVYLVVISPLNRLPIYSLSFSRPCSHHSYFYSITRHVVSHTFSFLKISLLFRFSKFNGQHLNA